MADISDVEQAIVDITTSILYPDGASQSSIVGALCRVYRGWPNSATLNTDLSAGVVNVTVSADNDSGRTTTRYLPHWQTIPVQPGTMASVTGQMITIGGSPATGDVVGALIDSMAYAYRIEHGDSPQLVASGLNLLIRANRITSVSDSSIFISGSGPITVRVVSDSTTTYESRRQEKDLRIICWCPEPSVRDVVTAAIDAAIDQIAFLPLFDGTEARIVYRNTASFDQTQNALLYRRDLIYNVEYPTITTVEQPSMLIGASDLNTNITYG